MGNILDTPQEFDLDMELSMFSSNPKWTLSKIQRDMRNTNVDIGNSNLNPLMTRRSVKPPEVNMTLMRIFFQSLMSFSPG